MPIFEYRCRDCGDTFEKIQLSSGDPVKCRKCQSEQVERMLSVFAVSGTGAAAAEPGPCPCGAPRRGMCGE